MPTVPPTLRIDLASATPAYRQIVDGLRALLVANAFPPGYQLPPVRQLAIDLAVHHNTVAQAYRELAEEGWLDLARRRGAIVRNREQLPASPAARSTWLKRMRELVAQGLAEGVPTAEVATFLNRLATELPQPTAPTSESSD